METELFYLLDAVASLNNSGVSLLRQHRYHDALLTFHDALLLIKGAVNKVNCNAAFSNIHIKCMLEAASRRQCQKFCSSKSGEPLSIFRIDEVSDCTSLSSLVSHIGDTESESSQGRLADCFHHRNVTLFAVKIEEELREYHAISDMLEIWSAIVISNQSVSLQCQSAYQGRSFVSTANDSFLDESMDKSRKAYQKSRIAYAVLSNQHGRLINKNGERSNDNGSRMGQYLTEQQHQLVSLVVVSNITIQIQSVVSFVPIHEYEQFIRLRRSLVQSFSVRRSLIYIKTAAAA